MISAAWNWVLYRFPQSPFKREVQLFRILPLKSRREDTFYFDSIPILIRSVYQSASKSVGIYWAPSGYKVVLWLSYWVWNINHIVKPKLNPQVVESAIQVVRVQFLSTVFCDDGLLLCNICSHLGRNRSSVNNWGGIFYQNEIFQSSLIISSLPVQLLKDCIVITASFGSFKIWGSCCCQEWGKE